VSSVPHGVALPKGLIKRKDSWLQPQASFWELDLGNRIYKALNVGGILEHPRVLKTPHRCNLREVHHNLAKHVSTSDHTNLQHLHENSGVKPDTDHRAWILIISLQGRRDSYNGYLEVNWWKKTDPMWSRNWKCELSFLNWLLYGVSQKTSKPLQGSLWLSLQLSICIRFRLLIRNATLYHLVEPAV
jgi:hypothetical protein